MNLIPMDIVEIIDISLLIVGSCVFLYVNIWMYLNEKKFRGERYHE